MTSPHNPARRPAAASVAGGDEADRVAAPWQRVRIEWRDGSRDVDLVRGWDRADALAVAWREWVVAPVTRGEFAAVRITYCGPAEPPPLAIPPDADRSCNRNGCDGTLAPDGPVHSLNEATGTATVDLTCDTCSARSVHTWELAGVEYRAQFGHDHDDRAGLTDAARLGPRAAAATGAQLEAALAAWQHTGMFDDLDADQRAGVGGRAARWHQRGYDSNYAVCYALQAAAGRHGLRPDAAGGPEEQPGPDAHRRAPRRAGPVADHGGPPGRGDPWRPAAAEPWRPPERDNRGSTVGAVVERGDDPAGCGWAPTGRVMAALPIRALVADVTSLPAERTRSRYLAITPTLGSDRCWEGWSVTHTPTGLRVGPALADPAEARVLAERLRGLDWSSPDPQTYQTGYRRAVEDAYRGLAAADTAADRAELAADDDGEPVDPQRAPAPVEQLAMPVTLPDAQAAARVGGPRQAAAAELRRLADEIDTVADPAGDRFQHGETAGRRDIYRNLLARATELDPVTGETDQAAHPAPADHSGAEFGDDTGEDGDDAEQLREHALSAADEAIGLFAHYRDHHGADEQTARAQVTQLTGDAIDRYLQYRQQPDLHEERARAEAAAAVSSEAGAVFTNTGVPETTPRSPNRPVAVAGEVSMAEPAEDDDVGELGSHDRSARAHPADRDPADRHAEYEEAVLGADHGLGLGDAADAANTDEEPIDRPPHRVIEAAARPEVPQRHETHGDCRPAAADQACDDPARHHAGGATGGPGDRHRAAVMVQDRSEPDESDRFARAYDDFVEGYPDEPPTSAADPLGREPDLDATAAAVARARVALAESRAALDEATHPASVTGRVPTQRANDRATDRAEDRADEQGWEL